MDGDGENDRNEEIRQVLIKGALFLAAFVAVIAVGTFIVVKALHLDADNNDSSPQITPPSALPSTALAVPGHKGDSGLPYDQTHGPGRRAAKAHVAKGLRLAISPVTAPSMARLNLTGTYAGQDNVDLQVQRWDNGAWSDFPVDAPVTNGTFATYLRTSQPGANRFRVYDPARHKGSNVVSVTIQ